MLCRVACEIQLKSYVPRHALVICWYNILCIYCKPIHTSLSGEQLGMTAKLTYFMTVHYRPHDGFYCQRCIVLWDKSWLATLHITILFKLIMCTNIKITKRYYCTSLQVCCQVAKKEHKLGQKNFVQNLTTSRDGPRKVQKQGRDENTRRLTYYIKIGVKKTRRLLYICCIVRQET